MPSAPAHSQGGAGSRSSATRTPPISRSFDQIGDYFGVPFRTDYVRKASLRNGVYGLLEIMTATETLTKLIELGLDAGQQWLMDQRARRHVKARRR
jgi:hypothetical protein